VGITERTVGALAEAGLDHVQILIQDSEPSSADHIAGYHGEAAKFGAHRVQRSGAGSSLQGEQASRHWVKVGKA
jgi:hypothetical protein